MAQLSRKDYEMIDEAIQGYIAHIEVTSTQSESDYEAEIHKWDEFKIKMDRKRTEDEIRMGIIPDPCDDTGDR